MFYVLFYLNNMKCVLELTILIRVILNLSLFRRIIDESKQEDRQ